jgi:hypothetical protein
MKQQIIKIDSIKKIENNSKRYDIETTTHNFIANNILVHNSSSTFFVHKTKKWGLKKFEFGVCSRNIWLKTPNNSSFWQVANKYDLKKKLLSLKKEIILQGEVCGPSIQKNKYKLTENDLFIFNVIENGKRYSVSEIQYFCDKMGLKHVPILDTDFKAEFGEKTKNEIVDIMVEKSKAKSQLYDTEREGIVCRLNEDPRVSFKVINPNFLLKNEEKD